MKSLCLVTVINPTIVVLVSHLSEVVDIAEKLGERKFLNNCDLGRQGFTTGRRNAAKTLLAISLINDVAENKARHLNMPDIGIRLFFLITLVDLSRFVYNKRKHSFLISRKRLTAITMIVNLCSE